MERDEIMAKARRNLVYAQTARSAKQQAKLEMAGFLDFMYPNMSDTRKRELIRMAQETARDG